VTYHIDMLIWGEAPAWSAVQFVPHRRIRVNTGTRRLALPRGSDVVPHKREKKLFLAQ
jgi:hypothetical protein